MIMAFSYEKENDRKFQNFYRFSFLIVIAFGIIGLLVLFFSLDLDLTFGFFSDISDDFFEIVQLLLILSVATLLTGWFQVLFTSKLGEEFILLVIWITPPAVIFLSVYQFSQSNDINNLGGALAGIVFFVVFWYFRKSIRLSARLIEVGAEITRKNPSLFWPQLKAYLLVTLVTLLMIPGVITVFGLSMKIHPILAWISIVVYELLFIFVVSVIRSIADAYNLSYINQWYDGNNPSNSKAKTQINKLKAPIVKYAFLMAFINRFKSNKSSGFSPFTLFKYMNFKNWPTLLFKGRGIGETIADLVAYFGNYTLVIIITKNMRSISMAYEESARSVSKAFAANIAGSMGFNILESARAWISSIILLAAGGYYGWITYNDLIMVVILALLFLILGSTPLNSMFKPVVNSYRLLLYRSYTGKISNKLDDKTKKIIKEAIK